MIEEFLDKIINTYVKEINKIHPLREEIPLFTAFVLSNVKQDDPKYFYLKKILLNLIRQKQSQVYKRIREVFQSIHYRSKRNQSIARSEAFRFGRKRSRRLV